MEKNGKYRGSKIYNLVFADLITAAKYRGTITYQEVAQIMGIPLFGQNMGKEVGILIGEISEDEHANGRPMLSAIVVSVNGIPGPGFYILAKQLGKFDGSDETAFWRKECQAVYETWKIVLHIPPK